MASDQIRDVFIAGLRNAHAMENQASESFELKLSLIVSLRRY